jgi:microcystin-dependent protein
MPSSNGVYSLPPGYLAVTGMVIQASQHNPPLEDIAQALTLRLSRDGSAPMTGPLQLAAGTVNAPGVVFATDASTGFYKTAAGFAVAVSGAKVVEFTSAGLASGAREVGELVGFTGTAAPSNLWLLPFGQTVSRTTYAALWAFAQVEIAAGNTLYNNGDGSTTFGIPDMRGRVPVGWDKMGGTAASRITTAGSGIDGTTLGGNGGAETVTLTAPQLPSSIPFTDPGHKHTTPIVIGSSAVNGNLISPASVNSSVFSYDSGTSTTGITINPSGGGAHNNVQPTLITNYILFAGGSS